MKTTFSFDEKGFYLSPNELIQYAEYEPFIFQMLNTRDHIKRMFNPILKEHNILYRFVLNAATMQFDSLDDAMKAKLILE